MPKKKTSKANNSARGKKSAKAKTNNTAKSEKTKFDDDRSDDTKPKFDITNILDKAQEFIDTYNYEMAQKFCQRALEMDNENIRALELAGVVLLEVGNMEAAKQCFGRSVELSPNDGHTKYMYLGQLMTGTEAVACFRKGIELMTNTIESQENQPAGTGITSVDGTPTMADISSAYLSISELYMTDLCDEENAEECCVSSIKKAIESDETNPEGYQILADYHLIKNEIELAREHVKKSVSLWLPKIKNVDESGAASADPIEVVSVNPEVQLKAAKTLIEVEEYGDATEVLELLLDQDDTDAEIWYMLGWCCYLQGEEYKVTARFYLTRCKEVAKKQKYADKDKLVHVDELLAELGEDEPEDEGEPLLVESSDEEEEAMDQQ